MICIRTYPLHVSHQRQYVRLLLNATSLAVARCHGSFNIQPDNMTVTRVVTYLTALYEGYLFSNHISYNVSWLNAMNVSYIYILVTNAPRLDVVFAVQPTYQPYSVYMSYSSEHQSSTERQCNSLNTKCHYRQWFGLSASARPMSIMISVHYGEFLLSSWVSCWYCG